MWTQQNNPRSRACPVTSRLGERWGPPGLSLKPKTLNHQEPHASPPQCRIGRLEAMSQPPGQPRAPPWLRSPPGCTGLAASSAPSATDEGGPGRWHVALRQVEEGTGPGVGGVVLHWRQALPTLPVFLDAFPHRGPPEPQNHSSPSRTQPSRPELLCQQRGRKEKSDQRGRP